MAIFVHNDSIIGDDGIADDKTYLVPDNNATIYSDGNNQTKSAGHSVEVTNELIKFIITNNGNSAAFLDDNGNHIDLYDKLVELPGDQEVYNEMLKMYDAAKNKENHFRELGAYIDTDGSVKTVAPGPVAKPGDKTANIQITDNPNLTTIHLHPIGIFPDGRGFVQFASPPDIRTAGNAVHYVIAGRTGDLYIYDKEGIKACVKLGNVQSFFPFK